MLSQPLFNQNKQNRVIQDLGSLGAFTPKVGLLVSMVGLIEIGGWISAESNLSADTGSGSAHLAANRPNG